MGRRNGGGGISKRLPKQPKIKKNTPENSLVQASSSARDISAEATSGEEDRKRKVPTNNRFTVNDIPLSMIQKQPLAQVWTVHQCGLCRRHVSAHNNHVKTRQRPSLWRTHRLVWREKLQREAHHHKNISYDRCLSVFVST